MSTHKFDRECLLPIQSLSQSLHGGYSDEETRHPRSRARRRRRPQLGTGGPRRTDSSPRSSVFEFGETNAASRLIYGLVGLAAVYQIVQQAAIRRRWSRDPQVAPPKAGVVGPVIAGRPCLGRSLWRSRLALSRPVVPVTRDGACRLGSAYWQEVERSTRGLSERVERLRVSSCASSAVRPPSGASAGNPGRSDIDLVHVSVLGGTARSAGPAVSLLEQRRTPTWCVRMRGPGPLAPPRGPAGSPTWRGWSTIRCRPGCTGRSVAVTLRGSCGRVFREDRRSRGERLRLCRFCRSSRTSTRGGGGLAASPRPERRRGCTGGCCACHRADELTAFFAGVDVVYHLVHLSARRTSRIVTGSRPTPWPKLRPRRRASDRLPRRSRRCLQGGSLHLRSRAETAERLASGSVPVTTLRSAIVVEMGALPSRRPSHSSTACRDGLPPLGVDEDAADRAAGRFARYLAGVAGRGEALDRTFDVAGPEVMTCRDMILKIVDLRGRRPLIVEVPVLTPRLFSLWPHLVTPVQAGVACQLVDGLRTNRRAGE